MFTDFSKVVFMSQKRILNKKSVYRVKSVISNWHCWNFNCQSKKLTLNTQYKRTSWSLNNNGHYIFWSRRDAKNSHTCSNLYFRLFLVSISDFILNSMKTKAMQYHKLRIFLIKAQENDIDFNQIQSWKIMLQNLHLYKICA